MRPVPDCKLCPLCAGRTKIVLPSGNLDSNIAFVGEAPGENEDIEGKPFVGRAGKILDEIMLNAGVRREDIMITNTVKCRPPNNRDPTDEEMRACRPFLEDELANCKVVVGLGRSACRDLIGYEGSMFKIANTLQIFTIKGKDILFIPTYHPAACIYGDDARRGLRQTMEKIKEYMS